jgi:hypothetical protein
MVYLKKAFSEVTRFPDVYPPNQVETHFYTFYVKKEGIGN